ncbi:CLUMA_CG005689, isoform A [Clunio marinus]|uniref:CLUMA_CG005689, isoform A n=1 Tax=Clunio marinus TaxID=568069 RepID=A0A1J1HVU7_9DIPT|nr:CLUMA_CG005689, isoform A [Clunio marinus]
MLTTRKEIELKERPIKRPCYGQSTYCPTFSLLFKFKHSDGIACFSEGGRQLEGKRNRLRNK